MSNKLTHLLKEIRLNTGDSLRDMSKKLGMSPSYLSAIENDKRDIPADLEAKIIEAYDLDSDEKEELSRAIADSVDVMKINTNELTDEEKRIIYEISKKNINKETISQMCEVIEKNKEGK